MLNMQDSWPLDSGDAFAAEAAALRAGVRGNARELQRLVGEAREAADRDQLDLAANILQQAASFAWFNHAGLFFDPDLEALLTRLGRALPPRRAVPARQRSLPRQGRTASPRVVLHVASQLYSTGGHTQMIARWIADDTASEHRIVTTRQGSTPYPVKVTAMLPKAPLALDRSAWGLLRRAALLREQVECADFVVVHAHPDDIIPTMALADCKVPSIFINHADHVFWVGASVAGILLHLRHSGALLSVARRGMDPDRSFLMNRPLAPASAGGMRKAERERLGIRDDQVLVVTAASESKYEPIGATNLVGLFADAVRRNPNLVVRAAGPRQRGEWARAQQESDGRIAALGPLPSVQTLFEAADLYVDSFPFSSLTSLLEAGSFGLPALSYRGHPEECAVLGADSPQADEAILYPRSPDEFQETVAALASDPVLRREAGDRLRHAVAAGHGESWSIRLEELYAQAGLHAAHRPDASPPTSDMGPVDLAIAALQQRTGYALGAVGSLRPVLGVMPFPRRALAWLRIRKSGVGLRPAELLRDTQRIRFEETALWLRRKCHRPHPGR